MEGQFLHWCNEVCEQEYNNDLSLFCYELSTINRNGVVCKLLQIRVVLRNEDTGVLHTEFFSAKNYRLAREKLAEYEDTVVDIQEHRFVEES